MAELTCCNCGKHFPSVRKFQSETEGSFEIDFAQFENLNLQCEDCEVDRPKMNREYSQFKEKEEAIEAASRFLKWHGQSYHKEDKNHDEIMAIIDQFALCIQPKLQYMKDADRQWKKEIYELCHGKEVKEEVE